ncbi:MAG: formate dehydrogenase accessory sulfurtransferase FdhD [Lautropia sp.]
MRRGASWTHTVEAVAIETPVAFEYNGIAQAVMLASPLDLHDFALGFSLSEGIIDSPAQLLEFDACDGADGITLRLRVAGAAFDRLKRQRRALAGRTGCGLCGVEQLSQVVRVLPPLPAPAAGSGGIAPAAIERALLEMRARQTLHDATGAVHAAAWSASDGRVELVREDVGRHNALDKLIGALARSSFDAAGGFIVVSSRASVEMVQKTVIGGVPLLAAVSAATTLAVDVARDCGLTLVGFARGQHAVAYTHPARLARAETALCQSIN